MFVKWKDLSETQVRFFTHLFMEPHKRTILLAIYRIGCSNKLCLKKNKKNKQLSTAPHSLCPLTPSELEPFSFVCEPGVKTVQPKNV